jgi:hypothetical protein
MPKRQDEQEVIEYVPKDQSPFRWWVVLGLMAAWFLVLAGIFFLKTTLLRIMLPVIMVALLLYLVICTISVLRRNKS